MKRFLILGAALILVARGAAAPVAPDLPQKAQEALSAFLKAAVDRGDAPGLVVSVVAPDRVVYQRSFGKLNVAGKVDMTDNAIFNIASMTKPLTSVAIMMLVEQGKLTLDDDVGTFLPAFKDPRVLTKLNEEDGTLETRPASRPITIRHLLSHTSGIGYAFSDPRLAVLQRKTRLSEPELPLLHDPGEKWTYGASTRVLGDVVQKRSGEPIDVFLRTKILEPLGMTDTSYAVPAEKAGRVSTIHRRTDGALVEQPNPSPLPTSVRGDGGLYSTAKDYGTFLRMFLNQGRLGTTRLLSEESIRLMTHNQIGDVVVSLQPAADPMRTRPFPLGAGADKFGLGFQIAVAQSTNPRMRSPGSYSWAGIDNTHFWVDPTRRIAVVMLMQVLPFYDDRAIQLLRGFEQLVNEQVR